MAQASPTATVPHVPPAAAQHPPRRRHTGAALALLAFAQLIIALDFNIVYVALPYIGSGLGFSAHSLQWVISAYLVAFGGVLLLGGRASDLLGRRRVFVAALLLYAASSLLGGLATSPAPLIAARAVQGVGGALLFPATLSLINTTFAEGRERNRALAVWGGAGASGLCVGSLLGGVLTDAFGWASVFYVNVPLAGIAAALAIPLLSPDGPRVRGRSFDLPGALAVTAGVTLLVYALVQGPAVGWGSPVVVASLLAAVGLLAAFLLIESRAADPLMPLRLLGNRSLAAGMGVTLMFMATFGATPYFYTVYFQTVRGYSPMRSGLAFLVPALVIAVGTQLGERLTTRAGLRTTLLLGSGFGAVGVALFAAGMAPDGTYAKILPGIVVGSLGQGMVWTAMWIAAAAGVASREQGVASGMASTAQQVGGAVGLAVLVAVADSGTGGLHGEALRRHISHGASTSLYIAAVGILLSAGLAFFFTRPRD